MSLLIASSVMVSPQFVAAIQGKQVHYTEKSKSKTRHAQMSLAVKGNKSKESTLRTEWEKRD